MSLTLDEAKQDYIEDPCSITAIIYLETAEEYHSAGIIEDDTFEKINAELSCWDMSRPLVEYLDGTCDPYVKIETA